VQKNYISHHSFKKNTAYQIFMLFSLFCCITSMNMSILLQYK